jgi:D-amino-acid oxidase
MANSLEPATVPETRHRSLAPLPPIREANGVERITVCTRPFRAAGPRIEPERLGDKLVIHNYGHGGSGWSLSWGSAALVVALALPHSREIAVVGAGALGLTAALALQRAGARVTLYARDFPPEVRSSRASGLWSPDSRFGLGRAVDAAGAGRWETLARTSWAAFAQELGDPVSGVEMHSRYVLSDLPPAEEIARRHREDPIGFVHLEHRLGDIYPAHENLGPGQHPFATLWARRIPTLRFNISAHAQHLLTRFQEGGGTLQRAEFHQFGDFARLAQPVIVHCTGYGARQLLADDSLIPVRGQIGWLPAQPELGYSLQCGKLSVVPRGDGTAVQMGASSDDTGWNDPGENPDPAESQRALDLLKALQSGRPALQSGTPAL